MGPTPISRDPALDAMRASAVALVLLAHAHPFMAPGSFPLLGAASAGTLGVEIFFSLSGFLIARLLLAQQSAPFTPARAARFVARRWLRTLPLWYAFLAVLAALGWHISPHDLILAHGFVPAVAWHLRHAWSLGVEELFYLSLPLAVLGLGGGAGAVARAAWIALLLGFTLRLGTWFGASPEGFELELFRTNPVFRIDAAAPGVLAACFVHARPRWAPSAGLRAALMAAALGLVAAVLAAVEVMFALGPEHAGAITALVALYHLAMLPALNLGAALAILALLGAWPPAGTRAQRLAGALARWSFGLYLFHLPIFTVAGPLSEGTALAGLPGFLLASAASIALAALSWRWFERPILEWRDRRLPAHPTARPAPGAPMNQAAPPALASPRPS
jgi:peptidoglycan/LPS O-acetylase OafA/YrhL